MSERMLKLSISLILISIFMVPGYCLANQDKVEDESAAAAIIQEIRSDLDVQDTDTVVPINEDEKKILIEQLKKYFLWNTGSLGGIPIDKVAGLDVREVMMTGLDFGMYTDLEGKTAITDLKYSEKSWLKMKDGAQYYFYRDRWWKISKKE